MSNDRHVLAAAIASGAKARANGFGVDVARDKRSNIKFLIASLFNLCKSKR